jgi:hypothetical protein
MPSGMLCRCVDWWCAVGRRTTVWQKLEEQNPEFFKAYYTRLKVKDQMELFNTLLEYQAQLLHNATRVANPVRICGGALPVACRQRRISIRIPLVNVNPSGQQPPHLRHVAVLCRLVQPPARRVGLTPPPHVPVPHHPFTA